MEEVLDAPVGAVGKGKIYKDIAVRIATFFGGPLAGGYMVAENFKVLNQPEKARTTWIITIVGTIVIIVAVVLIPGLDKVGIAFPLSYTLAAFYMVKQYQGPAIEAHINSGGQVYKWTRPLAIALIGLVVTVVIVMAVGVVIYLVSDASHT